MPIESISEFFRALTVNERIEIIEKDTSAPRARSLSMGVAAFNPRAKGEDSNNQARQKAVLQKAKTESGGLKKLSQEQLKDLFHQACDGFFYELAKEAFETLVKKDGFIIDHRLLMRLKTQYELRKVDLLDGEKQLYEQLKTVVEAEYAERIKAWIANSASIDGEAYLYLTHEGVAAEGAAHDKAFAEKLLPYLLALGDAKKFHEYFKDKQAVLRQLITDNKKLARAIFENFNLRSAPESEAVNFAKQLIQENREEAPTPIERIRAGVQDSFNPRAMQALLKIAQDAKIELGDLAARIGVKDDEIFSALTFDYGSQVFYDNEADTRKYRDLKDLKARIIQVVFSAENQGRLDEYLRIEAASKENVEFNIPAEQKGATRDRYKAANDEVTCEKIAAVFQEYHASELNYLAGIREDVVQGDEILFRGMFNPSFGFDQAVAAIEKPQFGKTPVSGVLQGVGSYHVLPQREANSEIKSSRISFGVTAATPDLGLAARYATQYGLKVDQSCKGVLYQINPKKGEKFVATTPEYRELDFDCIDPPEVVAVYEVIITRIGENEFKYEVIQTHKNGEDKNPLLQGNEVFYCDSEGRLLQVRNELKTEVERQNKLVDERYYSGEYFYPRTAKFAQERSYKAYQARLGEAEDEVEKPQLAKVSLAQANISADYLQKAGAADFGVAACLEAEKEEAVIVDPAGAAFKEGIQASHLLNDKFCGAGGASGALYAKGVVNRPLGILVSARSKGDVKIDGNPAVVCEMKTGAAALNLQNAGMQVIHAIGPQYQDEVGDDAQTKVEKLAIFKAQMQETMNNIVALWQRNAKTKDKELYIPCISGDIFGGAKIGDEYYKILIETLENALQEAAEGPPALEEEACQKLVGRAFLVPATQAEQQKLNAVLQKREAEKAKKEEEKAEKEKEKDKAKVLEKLQEKYQEYLQKQFSEQGAAEGDLEARLKKAKAVVIQQDHHLGARTNPEEVLRQFYQNESLRKNAQDKNVIALRNYGTAGGGHWDFRVAQTNDNGSYKGSTQESVSGAGLSCGAFTTIRILSKVCKNEAIRFSNSLISQGFSTKEIDKIRESLQKGKDLTADSGQLARRFVAKLVELQMTKEGKTDQKIAEKKKDVMTRQLEQEQITTALKYLGVESVGYYDLFQTKPQDFQQWFENAYFSQEDAEFTESVNTNRVELHSLLGDNKEEFTRRYLEELKGEIERGEDIFGQEKPKAAEENKAELESLNYEIFFAKMLYGLQEFKLQAVSDSLIGKEDVLKQQIDQFFFPTPNSLKTVYEAADGFDAKRCYELLRKSDSYCKTYAEKVNEYLQTCGYKTGQEEQGELYKASPERFKNVVESLLGLTKNNTELLTGFNKDQQDELFENVCKFAKATNQQVDNVELKKIAQNLGVSFDGMGAPHKKAKIVLLKNDKEVLIQGGVISSYNLPAKPATEEDLGLGAKTKAKRAESFVGIEIGAAEGIKLIHDISGAKEVVAGKDQYYEVIADGKAKYFTEAEAAASADGAKKSWRDDIMKYYRGEETAIPSPSVQAITVHALSNKLGRGR
jgi:hypothetical protein